jgi:hypothetical protein
MSRCLYVCTLQFLNHVTLSLLSKLIRQLYICVGLFQSKLFNKKISSMAQSPLMPLVGKSTISTIRVLTWFGPNSIILIP